MLIVTFLHCYLFLTGTYDLLEDRYVDDIINSFVSLSYIYKTIRPWIKIKRLNVYSHSSIYNWHFSKISLTSMRKFCKVMFVYICSWPITKPSTTDICCPTCVPWNYRQVPWTWNCQLNFQMRSASQFELNLIFNLHCYTKSEKVCVAVLNIKIC